MQCRDDKESDRDTRRTEDRINTTDNGSSPRVIEEPQIQPERYQRETRRESERESWLSVIDPGINLDTTL